MEYPVYHLKEYNAMWFTGWCNIHNTISIILGPGMQMVICEFHPHTHVRARRFHPTCDHCTAYQEEWFGFRGNMMLFLDSATLLTTESKLIWLLHAWKPNIDVYKQNHMLDRKKLSCVIFPVRQVEVLRNCEGWNVTRLRWQSTVIVNNALIWNDCCKSVQIVKLVTEIQGMVN